MYFPGADQKNVAGSVVVVGAERINSAPGRGTGKANPGIKAEGNANSGMEVPVPGSTTLPAIHLWNDGWPKNLYFSALLCSGATYSPGFGMRPQLLLPARGPATMCFKLSI